MRNLSRVTLLFTFLLLACSQSHSDAPNALARSYCQYVARCNEPAFASLGGTLARCIESMSNPECGQLDTALLTLSEAEAETCAKAMLGASCRHLNGSGIFRPELCARVQAREAAEGGSCVDAVCAEGLYCEADAECPTCTRYAQEGSACEEPFGPRVCEPGLLCHEGVCRTYLATGEPCESPSDCASRLCAQGRCVAPAALGERCERARDCLSRRCSEEGVCVDTPDGRLNDPCSETRDCRGSLECLGGRCVGSPEHCDGSTTSGCDCPTGQGCARGSDLCQDRLPSGAACTSEGVPCAAEHVCSLERGVCLPFPRAGEPCYEVRICASGSYCDARDSMCKAAKPDGQTCEFDGQCENGQCAQGRCGPPVCPP